MKGKNLFLPLFLTVVLTVINGCVYPLLLLAAVVIHEAAHVITAIAVGAEISLGRFLPCGLVLEYDCHLISPMKEAAIAAAGVAANTGIAAGCVIFADLDSPPVFFAFAVNTVLSAMNILPISGFDGAVIAERLLSALTDPMRAARAVREISDIGSVAFAVFTIWVNVRIGVNVSMLILSLYLDFMLFSGKS